MNPASYNYLGIPGMLIYVLLLGGALGMFAYTMYRRFGIFALLPKAKAFDRIPDRVKRLAIIGLGQAKIFKDPVAGPMHALIFWGFLTVGANTTHLVIRGFAPGFSLPLLGHGPIAIGYEWIKDLFQVLVTIMVTFAAYRRVIQRVPRLTQSGEALLILALIGILMVTDFVITGANHLVAARGLPVPHHEIGGVGLATSRLMDTLGLSTGTVVLLHQGNWWLHMFSLFGMLNLLPLGKHFHVITSLPNVFLGRLESPGKLERMDFENMPDDATFGVSKVEQYNWKQVLDLYSCTECGRCTAVCPANLSGKTLSPKHFNIYIRDHLYEKNDFLIQMLLKKQAAAAGENGGSTAGTPEMSEEMKKIVEKSVVQAWTDGYAHDHGWSEERAAEEMPGVEALWACTTCRNCEEACPVEITFVERFIELRRNLVLGESEFPQELVRTFKGMEVNSNPWNMSADDRDKWTDGLPFAVPRMADSADNVEYLFYVGCAGSFDERNMKITKATATVLNKAGVKFGILGKEETCNGDSARRAGNEYLYDMMATQLTETLNNYKVKKIITNCPHCFNTLKNEYPAFGGNFEVVHSTQFIDGLIKQGKVRPSKRQEVTMAYHDSCYMGRYNAEYDAPRDILKALPGVKMVEMADMSREKALCCGAGGARMWQEEPADKRVNTLRIEQALKALKGKSEGTGVASNCPFCMTMMSDAAKAKNIEETFATLDIVEMVAKSLE